MINPIASTGKPIELNTMLSVIRPTDGTPAVPIDATTAVKITVMNADNPKSIPYAWDANITAHPCIIAVPSMLMVAPRGIVNDEISFETPISDNFSIFNGIVAFDVDDENAKNMTEKNFLKNTTGFSLVIINISVGYTMNACIPNAIITQTTYFVSGIMASKPNPPNVLAIKQNTPIGAKYIIIEVMFIITLFN